MIRKWNQRICSNCRWTVPSNLYIEGVRQPRCNKAGHVMFGKLVSSGGTYDDCEWNPEVDPWEVKEKK